MPLTQANVGEFLKTWHQQRHQARTDLLWLCNRVLGYQDISEAVHGPLLANLQHFPGAREDHRTVADYAAAVQGKLLWEPLVRMENLPWNPAWTADRQCLDLFPRGHLKTSLVTIAHSIQWYLNYPNVRILGTTATETLITAIVIELRGHFVNNETLRFLFPEICPQSKDGKVPELGNLSGFTLPCRNNSDKRFGPGGKEPSFMASTVGSAITGYHGDVLKCDDLVEKINSSSQNGIDDVIRHYGSMGDLLEKYNSTDPERPLKGWVDVVGTPWDFSDLYQVIRNSEAARKEKGLDPMWNLCIRSAAPNWPDGPYLWPQRMGYKALKEIEDDPTKGPAQLSAQYLMNPIVFGTGLIDDIARLRWMGALEIDKVLPQITLRARMDLAGMDPNAKGADNDYTALTIGGFGDGTLYIPWSRYGRPPTEEVVEWIFEMFAQWPQVVQLMVEKASGGSQIEAWLRREMSSRGIWLPVEFVTRSNRESKVTRIKGLRPWFMAGKVALSDAIPYRLAIENEIKGFPKYRHDDWLDTVSDLMYEGKGEVNGMVVMDEAVAVGASLRNPLDALLAEMDAREVGDFEPGYDSITGYAISA